jgi:hypothetical protein
MGVMLKSKTLTGVALSASAPSAATDGISVDSGMACACVLSADSGATITGGSLLGYVYMPVTSNADGTPATFRWFPFAALNWTPETGARDAASGDKDVLTGVGRVAWRTSSVTVSAGTTVTLTMISRRSRG